jgi:hypothetical protein
VFLRIVLFFLILTQIGITLSILNITFLVVASYFRISPFLTYRPLDCKQQGEPIDMERNSRTFPLEYHFFLTYTTEVVSVPPYLLIMPSTPPVLLLSVTD